MEDNKKKVINELSKMKTLDLKIMAYTYDRLYHGAPRKFEFDIHFIKMSKCEKGWKSVGREQRRWSYKVLTTILKSRKD